MTKKDEELNFQKNDFLDSGDKIEISEKSQSNINNKNEINEDARWVDNQGNEVKKVFGFNKNAELVNARAAMFGFLMLMLTELIFKGEPATKSIFGIGL